MPYLGQSPSKGDENNFKILDDISSYTLTFDGSDSSVVSAANDTITSLNHRFVQGQRVLYHHGGGGSNIGGLGNNTPYFVIKEDHHTIKLATTASNASNGVAINITGVGGGSSHTLNVAFDGINTKFKATHTNGQKARITRSAQLVISINGVIQQPHDTATPSTGFGFDLDGTIVLSQAPVAGDIYWAHVLTNNNVTFDISDNDVDNFTGNGSTVSFNLSKTPPDNRNVLVTIDGVVQYPNDPDGTVRAYTVVENVLTFTTAPDANVQIQVRHIGFAGSTSSGGSGVTNFYGRTGSVVLKNTDNIVANNAEFAGNLTVQGTMTTLDTKVTEVDQLEVAANNTTVGVAITQSGSGDILKLYDGSSEVFTVATQGDGVGAVTISSPKPRIVFNETNASPDYQIRMNGGIFSIHDSTNGIGRISITSSRTDINNPVLLNNDTVWIGDKLVHWTDDNTAIRFPAYDTISMETAGSERLRIDPNGHITVGVGASSLYNTYLTIPRYTVDGDAANFISLRNDAAPADVTFVKSRSTTYGSYAAIQDDDIIMSINSDIDTGSALSFRGTYRSIYDSATGGVHFMWGSGASPSTSGEKMRLTATGNVGIGSVIPEQRLTVAGATDITHYPNTTVNNNRLQLGFNAPEGYLKVKNSTGSPAANLALYTTDTSGNTNKTMHLRYDSKVGIRTDNPTSHLHVRGHGVFTQQLGSTITNGLFLDAGDTGAGNRPDIILKGSGSAALNNLAMQVYYNNGSDKAYHLRYDGGTYHVGNIGIGTESPDRRLHILGTGNAIVKMEANYSGSVTGIEGVLTASGANRYVTGIYGKVVNTSGTESNVANIRLWNEQASPTTSDSPGYITFSTTNDGANSATEKLRIESGGGLKFTGQGTSIPVGGILHHTNNNLYVRGGTNGLILGNNNNTTTVQIYNGYIKFETNDGTEKLRINSSGKVIVGNNGTTFGNAAVQAFIQHGNTAGESGFSSVDTSSVAAGVGGEIAFHGKYNTGAQDYAYLGHIRGIKENATNGNTACALTFHTRPNATAPIERLRIDSSGRTLIGPGAVDHPLASTSGLDVSSGIYSIIMGGETNVGTGDGRRNAYQKEARLGMPHYTNAEEPFGLVYGVTLSGENRLNLGGGSSIVNAATSIKLYTAANTTTTAGTERLSISSTGEVLVNGDGSGGGYLRIVKDRDTAYSSSGGNGQDLIVQQFSDATNTGGYSSLALQCNYTGQTGAWVAINAVRTAVGEADLTINPRNNSTGDIERVRISAKGVVTISNASPPATGAMTFISNQGSATTLGTSATLRVANNGGNSNYSVFEAQSSSGCFRLSNSGRVFIGDAGFGNPDAILHVVGPGSAGVVPIAQFGKTTEGRYARFNSINNQQNFDHLLLRRYDNSTTDILRLQNTFANSAGYGTGIGFYGHSGNKTGGIKVVNRIANSYTARMFFDVSGTNIMHLEHSPNRVMIGEPSSTGGFLSNCPNIPLQARPSQNNTGPFACASKSYNTNFGLLPWAGGGTYISSGITYNNGNWIHQSNDNNNCLFYMTGGGWQWYSSNNGAGSWNVANGANIMNSTGVWTGGTSSDRRLKDNITNMSTSDALTKVTQLQGVSYTWKDEIQKKYGTGVYPEGTHYGFIAQDVKTVWPEAHIISDIDNESDFNDDPTTDVKDDVYYGEIEGVKLEKMVPLLVEAIKELKKENDALKARITTLEG